MRLRTSSFIDRLTPPRLLLVPGLVTFGAIVYELFASLEWPVRCLLDFPDARAHLQPMLRGLLCFFAASYGAVRGTAFHPVWDGAYAKWLAQTPWKPGRPLPLGPAHLVIRDLLPLAGIALLARYHAGVDPAVPLWIFAFAYMVLAGLGVAIAKAPAALVLAFGVPAMLLLKDRPAAALGAAVPLYGLTWLGIRQSLARFPWKDEEAPTGLPTEATLRGLTLGWPLDRLAPKPPPKPTPQAVGWFVGALLGWWVFITLTLGGGARLPHDAASRAAMFRGVLPALAFGGLIVGGVRALCYVIGYRWPLSLTGRLLTGRLLLPRYDSVFLAPLAVMATAVATPTLAHALGAPIQVTVAATIAMTFVATINLGPSMAHWRLTGAHHMVCTDKASAAKAGGDE